MIKRIMIILSVLLLTGNVFGQNVSDFQYTVNSGKVTITGYSGTARAIVIPNVINGLPVDTIGANAFHGYHQFISGNSPITSVNIPNSVTSIGEHAFYSNELTSVSIPNSVTSIGEHAFSYNQLTSVSIPNSVTSIGRHAFSNNQLTAVTIGSGVNIIRAYTFAFNRLTNVNIPNSVITIRDGAFMNNPLTAITIPQSVTSVDYAAFYGSSFPASVRSSLINRFGESIFMGGQ